MWPEIGLVDGKGNGWEEKPHSEVCIATWLIKGRKFDMSYNAPEFLLDSFQKVLEVR